MQKGRKGAAGLRKHRLYLQNALLLAGSGLALRVLGMGFRVVLSGYLGGEGMGLYQLSLALYGVFSAFATAGIYVAATRLAARSLARGQGAAATLRGLSPRTSATRPTIQR